MSAQKLANDLFNGGLVVMLLTLVTSLGMTFGVKQILEPLKKIWVLIATIVVNAGLAPLIAIGVCHVLPVSGQARVGLEIVTIAAAGPAALKACELAKRADMAMAVSFTIVLQLVNIIVAPLWAKAIVTGATVKPLSIVGDLLLLVLAPLVVGLVLRARYPEHRDGWKAGLEKISNIALYIAIVVGLAINWKPLVHSLGTWVIAASIIIVILYIAVGWAAGWLAGSGDVEDSVTVSMLSGMRFTPIGLVVISTVLHNQSAYLTPALIFALVDTVIPFGAGAELGKYLTRAAKTQSPAASTARTPAAPARPVAAGGRGKVD
jgi:BASS family bile acid:Na+ symporter